MILKRRVKYFALFTMIVLAVGGVVALQYSIGAENGNGRNSVPTAVPLADFPAAATAAQPLYTDYMQSEPNVRLEASYEYIVEENPPNDLDYSELDNNEDYYNYDENYEDYENSYEYADSSEYYNYEEEYYLPAYPTSEGTIPTRIAGQYRAPMIALTFDDGPTWLTPYLLDILDEYNVRVTFCVIGNLVGRNPNTILRAFNAGHEIIGHSWNHQNMSRLTEEEITAQIIDTSAIIEYVTGQSPPSMFRAPYGAVNTRVFDTAHELGYSILNWGIDPQDWYHRDEYIIYDIIMYNARDGAIIVLHDNRQSTIDAMAMVIPSLLYQGFELVTASEVIYHVYGHFDAGFEFTGTRNPRWGPRPPRE
ncbi:MAG: polysaccharide deacetylase family protein [Defluviitaleaceae bacterium]|nr:polysaccharide deacetylase family protein [Defluviitaleaceae bacterium]